MRSEKSYTKLEKVILRERKLKWFGQKILVLGFQWKYVESTASNISMQKWASSDDDVSNYSEKYEVHTQTHTHTHTHTHTE